MARYGGFEIAFLVQFPLLLFFFFRRVISLATLGRLASLVGFPATERAQ